MDNEDDNRTTGATDPAVQREWARKQWLRRTMRTAAFRADELRTLDERLERWTTDQQRAGKLPPDWQLKAEQDALERAFRQGRDEARPIFTPEEQRAVDASRAAEKLRDRVDAKHDYGRALSDLATQHTVTNGVGALDARKDITDRFAALYGRTVGDYAQEQRRTQAPLKTQAGEERLFPGELGWDKYEPAARRLAAHDAMLHIGKRDGTLSNREYHEKKKQRDRWMREKQQQGHLPTDAEIRKSRTPLAKLLLPYQKQIGAQETRKTTGQDGAYWRRIDELAGHLRQEIDETQRYARALDDYAIDAAGAYRKSVDETRRNIEQRFALHHLDTPAAYLESKLAPSHSKTAEAAKSIGKDEDREKPARFGRIRRGRDDNGMER